MTGGAMESLLPYFERELVSLRQLCREFHRRYPKVGGSLQLAEDICPDPHIEQLIESVALLSARVTKRLDDGYPEFTEGLLESLFPHCLRPFPSCTIVRATHAAVGAAGEMPVLLMPRGTELYSQAMRGIRCQFRTAYDIAVAPLTLTAARFDAAIRPPTGLHNPSVTSSVTIALEGAALQKLARARVYIDGEQSFCACLRDALFMRTVSAYVEVEHGQWRPLPQVPLKTVGFADDEALIPFGARSHLAYRTLSEYFAFPEKFNFFDIDLDALRSCLPDDCRQATLHFALSGLRPDSDIARMLGSLSPGNLLLGCSPAVNLFERPGQPIAVTHLSADYGVVADASRPEAFEVYSIDAVRMMRRSERRDTITEFRPAYAPRRDTQNSRDRHYWVARRNDNVAELSPGHEKRITLLDADFDPMAVEKTSVSIELTCTNRDLPASMPYGSRNGDLTSARDADSCTIRCLRKPTRQYSPGTAQSRHWRLISHLTLNHRALSQDGLPAFREMLSLHDITSSPTARRLIDGIVGMEQAEAVTWLRHKYGTSLVHGLEIRLTLDEEAFVGSGLHLFVQVIEQFFGLYVQLNSFIVLVVQSSQSGKELMRCAPRTGYLMPA